MRRRKNQGTTLVETVAAAFATVLAVGAAGSIWFSGAATWYRGAGKIDAETQSRKAVRLISNELAEAMTVTIDANGMGLSFQRPKKDANGDYMSDVQGQPMSDGIVRRIFLTGGRIVYTDGVGSRTLGRSIISTDPYSGDGHTPYKIFTPGQGAIVRQVTVMIVSQTTGANKELVVGRKRETVFLRNIYDTTR